MTRLVLHIGLHKTGTSSIQAFCHRNRASLKREGLLYEPMGRNHGNHHLLASQFQKDRGQPDAARRFLDRTFDAAAAAGCDVLISSEMLCETSIDRRAFQDLLPESETTVLCYLRHPVDLLVSAYNQTVRGARNRRAAPLDAAPPPYDPSFRAPLGPWLDWGRLVLCPYDKAQWVGGSLFVDFLTTAGMSGDGAQALVGADDGGEGRLNVSLPAHAVEAIRHLNAAGLNEAARSDVIEILQSAAFAQATDAPPPTAFADWALGQLSRQIADYRRFFRPGMDGDFLLRQPDAAGGAEGQPDSADFSAR